MNLISLKFLAAGFIAVGLLLLSMAIGAGWTCWRNRSLGIALGIVAAMSIGDVKARDLGQWEASDPAIVEWYRSLIQPDNAPAPCCGEADAYWADEVHVRDGKTYATITDDRPDEPRKRLHVDVGSVFEVPDHKLKWDQGNPTGHSVIFLSKYGVVYCFVQSSGS